jgi:hypothetical protein
MTEAREWAELGQAVAEARQEYDWGRGKARENAGA